MYAKAGKFIDIFRVSDDALPVMRYALGTTLIMAIAMGVGWELSFLTPVLSLGFFAPGATKPSLKIGIGFVITVTLCVMFGFFFTKYFIEYILAFIPLLAIILFHVYYNDKLNGMAKVFMLIALTLIPMLGLQSIALAFAVSKSLIIGATVTILVVWMIYIIFPDPIKNTTVKSISKSDPVTVPTLFFRYKKALETMLVVFPMLLMFLFFQWTGAMIVLIMVALLSMQPSFSSKTGMAMIVGNLMGGIAAIILFELLVVVPIFVFFLLLITGAGLFFATKLFEGKPASPLFGMAFSTMILVLGQSTGGTADAGEKVWMRVLQIMIAVIYLVVALRVIQEFKKYIVANVKI
jgi:DUF2955 family protein